MGIAHRVAFQLGLRNVDMKHFGSEFSLLNSMCMCILRTDDDEILTKGRVISKQTALRGALIIYSVLYGHVRLLIE